MSQEIAGASPSDGHRARLAAMIACQVGLHACIQGLRLAAPLRVLHDGQSLWWVGIVLSMSALGPALLAIPAGRLADRCGYHVPVRLACASALAGAFLAAAFASPIVLCIAAALCGAGSGVGMIALQRSAGQLASTGAQRLQVFSAVALAPALAGLFGPLLAGYLIDHASFTIAFLALALLPLASLFAAQTVSHSMPAAPVVNDVDKSSAWTLLRLSRFREILFVSWLASACWDVHGFALPVLGSERGISALALGAVLTVYATASLAVRLLMPVLAGGLNRGGLLVGGLVLACVAFALYPMQSQIWMLAVCAAMLGLALGVIQPAVMATLHDVTPAGRQGEALGVRALTLHMSMAAMPILFGLLGAWAGATGLFWGMAALLASGAVIAGRLTPVSTSST